jgi:hypothetical protein
MIGKAVLGLKGGSEEEAMMTRFYYVLCVLNHPELVGSSVEMPTCSEQASRGICQITVTRFV